jgi:hypothetical protein
VCVAGSAASSCGTVIDLSAAGVAGSAVSADGSAVSSFAGTVIGFSAAGVAVSALGSALSSCVGTALPAAVRFDLSLWLLGRCSVAPNHDVVVLLRSPAESKSCKGVGFNCCEASGVCAWLPLCRCPGSV